MTKEEILARIASDVADADRGMFGVRDITVGMTEDLFNRLAPAHFQHHKNSAFPTLFGCKVKVLPCSGLWWIVGYEGKADDEGKEQNDV